MRAMILSVNRARDRIEDIRVAWERDLERALGTRPRGTAQERPDPGRNDPRVRLERAMAERVHRVADMAAERLGCSDAFVLYQTPHAQRYLSAQALMSETPFAIRLIGPVASVLDDEALAALIGHELGHWLALGPHARPSSTVLEAWERGASADDCTRCMIAAEFTADRFSLIAAAGEVEAAVRLDVGAATLDNPRALGVQEMEHLRNLCRQAESGAGPFFQGDYPSSCFRMFATWLFWRSDLHRELTGVGPGDMSVRDVDARLRTMCDTALARERSARSREVGAWTQGSPPSVAAFRPESMAHPAPRWVEDQAHAIAASVGSAVHGFVSDLIGRPPRPGSPAHGTSMENEGIDDLEAQFLALERESSGARDPSEANVSAELEARFRALEEREERR